MAPLFSAPVIIGVLLACTALALLWRRNRLLAADNARLEARIEELGDRNWELKELAERSHTFLEALGDVIVRRGTDGRISYANDAFCRLAGCRAPALIGRDITLPLLEQGPVVALPDGTRMHDQKIAAPDGPRWIAWRDVAIRDAASGVSEIPIVRASNAFSTAVAIRFSRSILSSSSACCRRR